MGRFVVPVLTGVSSGHSSRNRSRSRIRIKTWSVAIRAVGGHKKRSHYETA